MTEKVNWLKVTYDESDNTKLKNLYTGWSECYDDEMVEMGYAYNNYIVELFPKYVDQTSKVLDLGCGSGYVGKSLHEVGYRNIHGIDYSTDMLAKAESKNIYISLTEANLKKPIDMIDSNVIDAIMCTGFFCRGHMRAEILDEVFRILNKGGHLICSIGTNIYESYGFADKILQLEKDNIVVVDEVTEPFVVLPENNATAESKMWVIRKL